MDKPKKGRLATKLAESVLTDLTSEKKSEGSFIDVNTEGKTERLPEAPEGLFDVRHGDRSKTIPLNPTSDDIETSPTTNFSDRTQPAGIPAIPAPLTRPAHGYQRPGVRDLATPMGTANDGLLATAENLKIAQSRILELEAEAEKLREENELLATAGNIAKARVDELTEKVHQVERSKMDAIEQASLEMKILKESMLETEREAAKARRKVEELEARLSSDLKRVRVRERDLENRLELSKLERNALVRSKDDTILDLKRRIDLLSIELENYKHRYTELQNRVESQNDQMGRTVRALRLALMNLESNDSNAENVPPLKKAE